MGRPPPWTVCKFYILGTCRKGDNCQYRHNVPGLAVKQQVPLLDSPPDRAMAMLVDGHIKVTFADGLVPDSVEDLHYAEDGLHVERIETCIVMQWSTLAGMSKLAYRTSWDARMAYAELQSLRIKNFTLRAGISFQEDRPPMVHIRSVPRDIKSEDILSKLDPRLRPAQGAYTHSFPDIPNSASISELVEGLSGRRPTEIVDDRNNSINRQVTIKFEGHARLDHMARDLSTHQPLEARYLKCGADEQIVLHLKIKTCIYRRIPGKLKNCARAKMKLHWLTGLNIHIDDTDLQRSHLSIFIRGDSRAAVTEMKQALERIVFEQLVPRVELRAPSSIQTHCIRFPKTQQYNAAFLHGGLERAQQLLGEEVVVQNTRTSIVVMRSTATLRQAQRATFPNKVFGKKLQCLICWDEFDEVEKIETCNHVACHECFTAYCASDNVTKFPLRCFEAKCERLLPTDQLRRVLGDYDFVKLANVAVEHHFRQKREVFTKCPGLDCNLYFPAGNEQVHDCPGCLTPSCPTCKVEYHYGETCQTYQERTSEHLDELNEWMEKAGAKKCPRCNGLFEKSEGCNNMTCDHCRQHFCYTCLAMFDDHHKVYAHLRREHGGFYDDEQQEQRAHRRLLGLDGAGDRDGDEANFPDIAPPPQPRAGRFMIDRLGQHEQRMREIAQDMERVNLAREREEAVLAELARLGM